MPELSPIGEDYANDSCALKYSSKAYKENIGGGLIIDDEEVWETEKNDCAYSGYYRQKIIPRGTQFSGVSIFNSHTRSYSTISSLSKV